MSPSVHIVVRATRTGGRRWIVRYRMGGRDHPLQHAGSFDREKHARERRDFCISEIAAGRDPMATIREIRDRPPTMLLREVYEAWLAARVDIAERTRVNIELHWKRLDPVFGDMDPAAVTLRHVQKWVNANTTGDRALSAGALRDYVGTLRQVLDFAEVDPNPARHRLLRLPARERQVPAPPTDKHVLAMLEHMPLERRLFFAFLEQDGGRVGEHTMFTWGDVDTADSRILARPEAVKGRRGTRKPRWVQVPGWLMGLLLDTTPPDDRDGDRLLFEWLAPYENRERAAWGTMQKACKAAGIPHFHPHDLRHRRQSLWHGQGIPAREIADRVGHSKTSISLDVYTHVMPLDEIGEKDYRKVLVR